MIETLQPPEASPTIWGKEVTLSFVRCALVLSLVGVITSACGSGSTPKSGPTAPTLLPFDNRQVAVNETLIVPLVVDNPTGAPLDFGWDGPDLPGLDRTIQLVGTPAGGEWIFTPLASHVGEHEFLVGFASPLGNSVQSLRVTVLPAASAAPVFLRPGAGATFDLAKESCVNVDVEVRDDDSASVDITVAQGMPDGASLTPTGPKSAHLEWCPTPGQVDASDRWPMLLQADDSVHPATQHSFIVILRRQAKDGCPGEAPVIAIVTPKKGEKVVSSTGYDVKFTVSDDQGLRDAPIAYWTTTPQEDLEQANLAEFVPVIAKENGGAFTARIPSLNLANGEERVVFVVLSATDNDDPNGTSCDHRTDTGVHRFIAVGGEGGAGKGQPCDWCDFSTDCASGVCALTVVGGLCVGKCGVDCSTGGSCEPVTTVEGAVPSACASPVVLCGSGGGGWEGGNGACTADEFEPNDATSQATPMQAGALDAAICPGDSDMYRVEVTADTLLSLTLAPVGSSTGDLDLQLRDASGSVFTVSADAGAEEQLTVCSAEPTSYIAEVLGYAGQGGPYSLTIGLSSQSCCTDDAAEPDDSAAMARSLALPGLAEGTICPYDDDYLTFDVGSPSTISLFLAGEAGGVDVDLQVYGPSGGVVAASESFGDESLTWSATAGPHVIRVFGYMGDSGDYLLEASTGALAGCSSDKDCPIGTVCDAGSCEDAFCTKTSQCPAGYACPYPGPIDDFSLCGAPCTSNSGCRPEEACKYFYEGRFCGGKGSGQNGDPCDAFFDCGGQRSCIPWPGGYCARDNCKTANDCEAGTFCVPIDGVGACVVDCWASDSICRLAEGYTCDVGTDVNGDYQLVCVP